MFVKITSALCLALCCYIAGTLYVMNDRQKNTVGSAHQKIETAIAASCGPRG